MIPVEQPSNSIQRREVDLTANQLLYWIDSQKSFGRHFQNILMYTEIEDKIGTVSLKIQEIIDANNRERM